MVQVLFVHDRDCREHFGAAERERSLAIEATQIHKSLLVRNIGYATRTPQVSYGVYCVNKLFWE